jgi:serine/threonine protein kinase
MPDRSANYVSHIVQPRMLCSLAYAVYPHSNMCLTAFTCCIMSLVPVCSARCILSGLKSIHAAGFGHGDLRWPNVIVTGRDHFVLIDLEGAVKLGTVFDTASVDSLPTAWRAGEVLRNGQYTVQSDLQQVADMIRATGVSMDDMVLSLTTASTADEVLQRLH